MQYLISHADGVHTVESGYGRPQLAAVHLVVHDGRAAWSIPAAMPPFRACWVRWRRSASPPKRWSGSCSPTSISTTPAAPAA